MEIKPLVTVVTVVYNGVETIEQTILSIIKQDYSNIEYIVIDGGSLDGTLDIIKRYEQSIDYWISEPDAGIYDAMNKGIDALTGQWVMFMNSGDVYYSQSTIHQLVDEAINTGGDLYYGDHVVRYPNAKVERVISSKESSRIWSGMPFCHQSLFVKACYHKNYKFNLNYKVAADYDFVCFLRVIKEVPFNRLPIVVSIVLAEGLSDLHRDATIKDQWLVSKKYFKSRWNILFFYFRRIDAFVRISIKKLILVK